MSSHDNPLLDCRLCPRKCGVNRVLKGNGYCRTGSGLSIASICLHKGEEPVLSGEQGIVNVFFRHCNLQCLYCQNHQISRNDSLYPYSSLKETVDSIERLLPEGTPRIGFVSPSHVLPQMKEIMYELEKRGKCPIYVYNTNGYDDFQSIRSLEGNMDVYLPDLKYQDKELAQKYSGAADYPEVAEKALLEMFRQKGPELKMGKDGLIRSGLIIRHLVLPGHIENSIRCLRFIAHKLSREVSISLMSQYFPTPQVTQDPHLGKPLTLDEYEAVLHELDLLGMENGWIQELESHETYRPDFEKTHPFEDL